MNAQGSSNPTLSIDRIDKTSARWKKADILVFNTGHWWAHGKTARGLGYNYFIYHILIDLCIQIVYIRFWKLVVRSPCLLLSNKIIHPSNCCTRLLTCFCNIS
jgi:hypothetical protein